MQKVRLGDVCTKGSSNISQKDLEKKSGIYPIYGASGFIKNVDFYKQENEYIALVKDGAGVGRVMKCPEKSSVIGTMQYIFPNDNINISFLAYVLEKMDLSKFCSGATIPHIYFKDYCNQTFLLPSLEQQQQIVSVLDKISLLIDKRKKQLKKLDELVKSRFVEMFGNVVANDRRWPMAKFGDVTDSRLGKMLDAKKQTGRNIHKYLANFNVQWFRIDDSELREMDFDAADQIEFELKEGDLLVCEGGESGRCCVWRGQIRDCYYQKALHRVRCNPERLNPDFLAYWFWMNCHHGAFEHIIGAKATIAHLPGVKLKKLDVILPPLALQREFAAFVEKVDKLALKAKASLDKLETLKKAQMQKYFG